MRIGVVLPSQSALGLRLLPIVLLLAAGILALGAGPAAAACEDPGPDAYGYTCEEQAGAFVDISEFGADLALGDDQTSALIDITLDGTLPPFLYYGKAYSAIRVSSNGFLTFGTSTSSGCCDGPPFPHAAQPNAVVGGYWTDLNPMIGGTIHHATLNDPDRFVLQFTRVPQFLEPDRLVTFQIVLHLGTSVVEVTYGPAAASQYQIASTGIENHAGNVGLTYRRGVFHAPGNGALDVGDQVYLALDSRSHATEIVRALDVRIIGSAAGPAGTAVAAGDGDARNDLVFGVTTALCYIDENSDSLLSTGEPLYLANGRTSCSSVQAGDMRLSASGAHAAGTFVQSGDADASIPLLAASGKRLMYHDANANALYDAGDFVYLKSGPAGGSSVGSGDYRLTPTLSHPGLTYVTAASSDLSLPLLQFLVDINIDTPGILAYHDAQKRAAVFQPPAPGLPSPPGSVTAVPESTHSIAVSWQVPGDNGMSHITAYEVHRADPITEAFSFLDSVPATSLTYEDSTVGPGETWLYAVLAVNGVGPGPLSAAASATAFDAPSEPLDLIAVAGPAGGEIQLSWNPPASDGGDALVGYRIYAGDDPEELEQVDAVDPWETEYIESGLGNGATRYYRVSAENAYGEGPRSDLSSATTFDLPEAPLLAGAAVVIAPDEPGIEIAWEAPFDGGCALTFYHVYSGATSGSLALVANLSASTLAHLDSVAPGETRYYAVAASNCLGMGPQSDEVAVTAFDHPSAPRGLSATGGPGPNTISLAWDDPASDGGTEVTAYALYRATAGESLEFLSLVETTDFLDEGLPSGVTFTYAVAAQNALGEGPLSDPASAMTVPPPGAPGDVIGTAGPNAGEISLSWSEPETHGLEVSHYRVYRGTSSGHLHFLVNVSAGALGALNGGGSFVDSGLPNDALRYYAVSAVTAAGEGELSNEAHAATFAPQGDPPPLPEGRAYASAIFQGHYAYLFGGVSENNTDLDTIVRFDPSENEVITLDVLLPSARHGTSAVWVPGLDIGMSQGVGGQACHGACFDGGGIIFGGGKVRITPDHTDACHGACVVGKEILRFDPGAELIVPSAATFPEPIFGTSAVYDEELGLAYVFGGFITPEEGSDSPGAASCHPFCASDRIWSYEPASDGLSPHDAELPVALGGTSAVWDSVAGVAYIFGGYHGESAVAGQACHGSCMDRIWLFDPAEASVDPLPVQLPSDRWNTSAVWDGNVAYIFGGFDPQEMTVTLVGALPSDRAGTAAIWTGSGAYVFGGDDGTDTLDEIVRFTPSAPQGLRAQRGPGVGQMKLSWDAPLEQGFGGVTGYRLYRATEDGPLALVAESTGRFHLDSGLEVGVTYRYRVSAVNAVGEGPQSKEVVVASAVEPGPPRFLQAHPGPGLGQIRLQWYHPLDNGGLPLLEYRIYHGTDPSNLTLLATVSGSTVEYVHNLLNPTAPQPLTLLEDHYYRVAAVNFIGEGDPSGLACSRPAPWVAPLLEPAGACAARS
jgi:hypothetical protein